MDKPFASLAIRPDNPKYRLCAERYGPVAPRESDIRSPFTRDYTRILHTRAFSRLKNKTQVFFATRNDHICTRMEHVNHVSSISSGICKHLGLNEELALAIATGHDLGHAPFGHTGERILGELARKHAGLPFFHETNSLRFIDLHETLEDTRGTEQNLNLTYGVRDGILFHCGESLDKVLFPREEPLILEEVTTPASHPPFTWEGCVVKISDIIAYAGRDIEDALRLKILDGEHMGMLEEILSKYGGVDIQRSNNTSLIHHLVTDLCRNSSPEEGLRFSRDTASFIGDLIAFNYEYIYENHRLKVFQEYARLILNSLFRLLLDCYRGKDTVVFMEQEILDVHPELCRTFTAKLTKYSDLRDEGKYQNRLLYRMDSRDSYVLAVIDYLASLTDFFAMKLFGEITAF